MNKVILMGRLTRDPEVRYTQTNNTLVASFSLAVNRRFVRQGEERQADFINIVAWSKLGEFCSKYFKKGQQVDYVLGDWTDEETTALKERLDVVSKAVKEFALAGLNNAMNNYNGK